MPKTATSPQLKSAKNLARGALSRLHQESIITQKRGDAPAIGTTSAWSARIRAKAQLNRALSKARAELTAQEFSQFEAWLIKAITALDSSASSLGVPLAGISTFPTELNVESLEKELFSCARILSSKSELVLTFTKSARDIAFHISKGEYARALELLEIVRARDGYSFWYVETRLALLQLTQGVEELKKEVKKLSIGGSGLSQFIFRQFGIRNEPAQNPQRFRISVRKLIDESKLSQGLGNYVKFRLYGALEVKSSYLADILAYERETTAIDLLFTLTKICKLVQSQKKSFPEQVVRSSADCLDELAPATSVLGISSFKDNYEDNSLSRKLLIQSLNFLFDESERTNSECSDIHAIQAIANQLSTRDHSLNTDETSRTFVNMNWLPAAVEVGDVYEIPTLPSILLNTGNWTSTGTFVSTLNSILTERKTITGLTPIAQAAAEKIWHVSDLIRSELYSTLEDYLAKEIESEIDLNLVDAFTIIYANTLYSQGDLLTCTKICARAGRENERLMPLLPLTELFVGKRWPTIRTLGPSIDLAIALSHATRQIDDSKLRTFKRYAVEELIVVNNCLTVADLIPVLDQTASTDEVEYFGEIVCDIPTLELLPGMDESRGVRHVRVEILRQLAELNGGGRMKFELEAQQLEDALQVDDGLSVLDDSKVHVDEQAVIKYALTEFDSDFKRYKKLVASGVGQAESLSEILKNIDEPSAKLFQIPKNDADDLLLQIVNSILQRFLSDPAAGLDIIIGRRIRHGTIAGELRGVLEKMDLIGTITHGKYEPSRGVVRLCQSYDAKCRKIIYAANARFSEAIDQLVALLRDQYFHVRSRGRPRGVYEISINPVVFTFLRKLAQTCSTLEQFVPECVAGFWLFLSFKLEASRPTIEAEVKRSIKHAFQKFTAELTLQRVDAAFVSNVQRAADELQRRATTISNWINVPKVRLESRTYGIERTIDIAVAVVSGQRPGFSPKMKYEISTDVGLDSHGFSLVSDALYIALDNVAHHSGKKIGNEILVAIGFDEERSFLTFDVTSETMPAARRPEKVRRLNAIKADIQRRTFIDGARKDKHSGLFKLAALVSQVPQAKIDFGFTPAGKFNVQFDLLYIPISSSRAD